MPPKAWRRAIFCTLAGVLPLAALARASWNASPAERALYALVALAILGTAGYLMWLFLPDVDLPGRTIRRGRAGQGRIAITFDDGPNGTHTREVLDTLRRHGARATFFCVGESARAYPELIRRMVEEGHAVGNHTTSHAILPRLPKEEVERQIATAQSLIESAGAPRPTLFRAPKGFKHPALPGVLRRHGLRLVGWSHGVWDTDRPGVEVIVGRARKCLADGKILLLHDGLNGLDRAQTAAALEEILRECSKRGLTPVTIPELVQPSAPRAPAPA